MAEKNRGNLPWLDRLSVSVPGYGGYQDRNRRRDAAYALRDAILQRLGALKADLDLTARACTDREAHSEAEAVERVAEHLARISTRLQGFGSRAEEFYDAPGELHPERLDPIYAIDHELYERAERMAASFEKPEVNQDLLARLESDLSSFENKMDERSLIIRSVV